jgi:hypothetical protein
MCQGEDTHPQNGSEPTFRVVKIIVYDFVGQRFFEGTVFILGSLGVRHSITYCYTVGLRLNQNREN